MIQNNYNRNSYGQDRSIVSPIQLKNRPYDIQNNRAVQDEIKKNIKVLSLTAEFTEDKQTLDAFRHINGIIAFLCTLKKDGQVIGFGRGMSVVSKMNRFMEKTINYASNAALIDAVVRAAKVLDVMHIDFDQQSNVSVPSEVYGMKENQNFVPISPKQRGYLLKLLESSGAEENELNEVDELSRSEAASRINMLVNGGSKINY